MRERDVFRLVGGRGLEDWMARIFEVKEEDEEVLIVGMMGEGGAREVATARWYYDRQARENRLSFPENQLTRG